ncbi:phosphatidate cytidylyltransferase [Rothia sp. AR01]|uniref:Phosphatidate cytidylyltransferase n=1 Tax=Rothia santali TaxID=2949643 RepID=A0A9X2KGQ3_9MICC|nr:phosphatidate cytidylyltransferase [Rothia santali]MCP3425077.1 phosphatidate cytidylyltransferase [Rothia santali]
MTESSERPAPSEGSRKRTPRAGRDLPAAIGVGAVLVGLLVVGLFFVPLVVVALAAVAAGVGTWEIGQSLNKKRKMRVPLIPAVATGAMFPFAAFYGGSESLVYAVLGSIIVVILWRALGRRDGMLLSIMGSIFTMLWVPFMLALAVLLFRQDDGAARVFTIVLMAIGNDTWGYIAGVLWGKHPMAPRISPKKTWEGMAGSLIGSIVVGVLCAVLLLGEAWWVGVVLAVLLVIASTAGDLSESMIKREIGIKDMSNILPGHGGVMDRLDSIVFAIAAGYVVFVALG